MAKRTFESLTALYENWNEPIVTAHRGLSGSFPENTAFAMRKAIACGTDMIEFDVCSSRDGVPVILHDLTLNRTSNLTGKPEEHDYAELMEGNFSYKNTEGKPIGLPAYKTMPMPSLETLLQEFRGQAGMNIQVKPLPREIFIKVCHLYCDYSMYDMAFLTLDSMEDCLLAKEIDNRIEICYAPSFDKRMLPETLDICRNQFGCRFVQPPSWLTTPEQYELCRKLSLRTNVFYSDTEVTFEDLLSKGATGCLSNRCDVILEAAGRL